MKFHAILVTRDSSDIIIESLQSKVQWADYVYVYDTGSTDGTWEMIQEFARKDERVIPFKREPIVFHEGVRAFVFEAFRKRMEPGDWVVKSDEDEFYHVSPRDFVANRLSCSETAVWVQTYEFRLTESEAATQRDPDALQRERCRPVVERRRHYVPLVYSEHRMCRYRRHMKWYPTGSFPTNAGIIARARIPMRHYPHRDILQLQQRVRLRETIAQYLPPTRYRHWKCSTWQDFIVPDNMEGLLYWGPNERLPEFSFKSHLPPAPKRLAQIMAHHFVVPWFDRFRAPFPAAARPQLLSEDGAQNNDSNDRSCD
jgi:Glycosyl transferase family 2